MCSERRIDEIFVSAGLVFLDPAFSADILRPLVDFSPNGSLSSLTEAAAQFVRTTRPGTQPLQPLKRALYAFANKGEVCASALRCCE